MLSYIRKMTRLIDLVLWILIVLGIVGGALSAYVISSSWVEDNGSEATVRSVRPVRDACDRNSNSLSLDGQRPIEAGGSRERIR
jgi:hypothetical protein